MDAKAETRAADAIHKAAAAGHGHPGNGPTWEALATRYSSKKSSSRKGRDEAYAKAMRRLASEFPDDVDAAVLFVESMMVLGLGLLACRWSSPTGTEDISHAGAALGRDPNHPGACHYYIHAVERRPNPTRFKPAPQRLPSLMPGAGHPCICRHIYTGGRYRDASSEMSMLPRWTAEYLLHHPLRATTQRDTMRTISIS